MTVREDLIQAVREVVQAATSITDAQIIPADDDGPRPALPYLTVSVASPGRVVSRETLSSTSGGAPTYQQRVHVEGTCTITAYGRGGEEWLDTLALRMGREDVLAKCEAQGITLDPTGASAYSSIPRDTGREEVTAAEYAVLYQLTDTAEVLTELGVVEAAISLDRYTGDPDAQSISVSVTL